MYMKLDDFDTDRPFGPWLRGIARNHMLGEFRSAGRYRRRLEGLFAERIESGFAAVDARWAGNGWRVHTHGGFQHTQLDVLAWCRELADRGAGEILLTSMDRDGTQAGYDCDLIRMVSEEVRIPVIASGGAGRVQDFVDAVNAGASAVLAASLFHFRTLTIREVKDALDIAGHPVRTTW